MFFEETATARPAAGSIALTALAAALSLATGTPAFAQAVPPDGAATRTAPPQGTTETADKSAGDDTPVKALAPVRVRGIRDPDVQGHENVFRKNVTNLYVDRKELDRYQTTNPADVFKGMNGVYSMDSRNGASISPNIRGLSGQGRIPVTVDGTEQSTDIWLGTMFGANNKSYVDPGLFRSVTVEKGPSLTRGVKSGVGGAVSIRTIEPSDIIPAGESLGIELKAETSGNTIGRGIDPSSYFGQDYRNIPGATARASGAVDIPMPPPRSKDGGDVLNFKDRSVLFTIAGRNDVADALLSYSERTKGNYFAGKNGAGGYRNNDAYAKSTEAYLPNLTKLYHPGDEVFNTSSDVRTLLAKSNLYLPHDQKIGLSFMRSWLEFGETNNVQALLGWGLTEAAEHAGHSTDSRALVEFPRSDIRMDTLRLSYELTPADSRWVNLQSSLWMTSIHSRREQNGGSAYFVRERDAMRDDWYACRDTGATVDGNKIQCIFNPILKAPTPPDPAENTDGRYNVVAGSTQWTDHKRVGFDVSNLFRISDKFSLTVTGEGQYEKLSENVLNLYPDSGSGLGPDSSTAVASTEIFGPRSGRRHEWAATLNMEWRPTAWLTLGAGTRYSEFWAYDDGLATRRANRVNGSQITQERTGVTLEWGQLMTNTEAAQWNSLRQAQLAAGANITQSDWDQLLLNGITTPAMAALQSAKASLDTYVSAHGEGVTNVYENGINTQAMYWKKKTVVPVVDGKVDSSQSPFANGSIDPNGTATDPQGLSGQHKEIVPISATPAYTAPAAGEQWKAPEHQTGHAWAPVFSATVRLTDHISLFGRYAQTTRFPSVFEIASTSIGMTTPYLTSGATKPERSTNWEIGYAHDLTGFFPQMKQADIRLSYFDTRIRDFIDRDAYLNIIQYDRKESSGLEFQSHFDTGRWFGGLGATWRLRQKLCDKDYAYGMDPFYNRVPECMTGGFPDAVTSASLLPPYSINAELGTRLLSNKLEVGMRALYHAKARNDQLDDILSGPLGGIWVGKATPQFYWQSVLLLDAYAQYQVSRNLSVNLGVTNLTDLYYMDPMSKTPIPGPGRTVTLGMQLRF